MCSSKRVAAQLGLGCLHMIHCSGDFATWARKCSLVLTSVHVSLLMALPPVFSDKKRFHSSSCARVKRPLDTWPSTTSVVTVSALRAKVGEHGKSRSQKASALSRAAGGNESTGFKNALSAPQGSVSQRMVGQRAVLTQALLSLRPCERIRKLVNPGV